MTAWRRTVGAGRPRHRLVQQPGQLLRPGPARRRPVPQAGQGVHDQVDHLVAEPPHLLGREGSGGAGGSSGGMCGPLPPGVRAHPSDDASRRAGGVP